MIYFLFDSLLEPTFVLSAEGHIIYCNETAAIVCGSTPRKLVRAKIKLAQAIQFAEPLDALANLTNITTATPYKELKFSTESYENGKAQITIQPYTPQPDAVEYIVFFRDVTLEERLQKKYRAELEQKESYIHELQSARNQLELYSKNLESLVKKRTAEIQDLNILMKALLDSLNQAFFVFDQNGICAPFYSRACIDMLEVVPSGQNIWDVLKIPTEKVEGFQNWLLTLFSEMLPFDDLKPLGPTHFPHTTKSISLEYFPIRNENDKIEKIVCVGSDVTDLVLAQNQAEQDRAKVDSILKMIQNKKELRMFLLETKSQIASLGQEFAQLASHPDNNRDSILRILHTIKGGAATFSYNALKDTAHKLEEHMLPEHGPMTEMNTAHELKKVIESEASSIISFYNDVFGELQPQEDENTVFSPQDIQTILKFQKIDDLRNYLEEKIHFQPVKNLVSQFGIVIEKTALLLEKPVQPLQIRNDLTLVPRKVFDPFFSSFIHVLRNSVDHGIESSSIRQQLGKDPAGTVTLEFNLIYEEKKYLQVKYRDDGQGIHPSQIRAKLTQKNIPHAHLSDDQVIYYVFNPSFSTRDNATETSGRGIGLDAVKYEVDQLGGKLEIRTELNKYTEFIFLLPYPKKNTVILSKSA
ncbi:MAG: Hpt domain-containing protein [Bdellovibrionaceae bacterium]|nr:Hpt domain-containing protein [Pseudobdellovibrionaceae bacterium]